VQYLEPLLAQNFVLRGKADSDGALPGGAHFDRRRFFGEVDQGIDNRAAAHPVIARRTAQKFLDFASEHFRLDLLKGLRVDA